MKYIVLILDGAAGRPIAWLNGRTCLEAAFTPNLDRLAPKSTVGLVCNVPSGMEPSSACACLSILGYDPRVYYKGRGAIEAISVGVPLDEGDVVFRCNLVSVKDGKMSSYAAGYIPTEEASELVSALNEDLGNDEIRFYTGTSYRHLLKLKNHPETLRAVCTPPHDIPEKEIAGFLPSGEGSALLRDLMFRSREILENHPVNRLRARRGEPEANMIWPFWGSEKLPPMPSFEQLYGFRAALTSGVDLLKGLAELVGIKVLEIEGVTDNLDNDFSAQAKGAIESLDDNDMVIIHIEAPDEAGHSGEALKKIRAIELIDQLVLGEILSFKGPRRLFVLPDHPTPVEVRTHTVDPVPFMLNGPGFDPNGAAKFNEDEARKTGLFLKEGYKIMDYFLRGKLWD